MLYPGVNGDDDDDDDECRTGLVSKFYQMLLKNRVGIKFYNIFCWGLGMGR